MHTTTNVPEAKLRQIARPLEFSTLVHSAFSPFKKPYQAILTLKQLQEEYGPLPDGLPSDRLYIVVAQGECPTGGYSTSIKAVTFIEDGFVAPQVQVFYEEIAPRKGSIVTQVLTSPIHIVTCELVQYDYQVFTKI